MPWTKTKSFALETLAGVSYRAYLLSLLQAQALFPAGLKGIHHGQSKAYYDTMLALAEFGESAREVLEQFGPNRAAAISIINHSYSIRSMLTNLVIVNRGPR